MNHGSLFSGIGGFDLAAEWMGWNNLFHCEWNPFGQKVLKHYWPKAESFNDITKTDFTQYANRIQILTGGFPCQPYSSAGKRKGKDDERHLWPEMLRAIREIRPRWVVGENVLGLVNWSGGLVFHEVQADLEAQGYEVQPFLLPAAAVNAPHRRDRIWFVAHNNSFIRGTWGESESREQSRYRESNEKSNTETNGFVAYASSDGSRKYRTRPEIINPGSGRNALSNLNGNGSKGIFADAMCNGVRKSRKRGQSEQFNQNGVERGIFTNATSIGQEYALENRELERRRFRKSDKRDLWDSFPSQPPVCGGDDGLPTQLDGITFSKWRNESIKGYGNAIVPQVVYQIFKAIEEYENSLSLQ